MSRPSIFAVVRALYRLLGGALVQATRDIRREFRIYVGDERARDAGRREK